MALSTIALFASVTEVKPWVLRDVSSSEHDSILEDLINSISEDIEAKTGRVFVSRTVTEQRLGDGSARLRLLAWPVTADALTTFTIDDDAVAEDDYVLMPDGVIVLLSGVFTRGALIDLVYTAGYALADVPARVRQLAKDMIKIRYDQWVSNSSGVTSMSQGQVSMVPLPDWPYAIKHTLDDLRREQNP